MEFYRPAPWLNRHWRVVQPVTLGVSFAAVVIPAQALDLKDWGHPVLLSVGVVLVAWLPRTVLFFVMQHQTRKWVEGHPLAYLVALRQEFGERDEVEQ